MIRNAFKVFVIFITVFEASNINVKSLEKDNPWIDMETGRELKFIWYGEMEQLCLEFSNSELKPFLSKIKNDHIYKNNISGIELNLNGYNNLIIEVKMNDMWCRFQPKKNIKEELKEELVAKEKAILAFININNKNKLWNIQDDHLTDKNATYTINIYQNGISVTIKGVIVIFNPKKDKNGLIQNGVFETRPNKPPKMEVNVCTATISYVDYLSGAEKMKDAQAQQECYTKIANESPSPRDVTSSITFKSPDPPQACQFDAIVLLTLVGIFIISAALYIIINYCYSVDTNNSIQLKQQKAKEVLTPNSSDSELQVEAQNKNPANNHCQWNEGKCEDAPINNDQNDPLSKIALEETDESESIPTTIISTAPSNDSTYSLFQSQTDSYDIFQSQEAVNVKLNQENQCLRQVSFKLGNTFYKNDIIKVVTSFHTDTRNGRPLPAGMHLRVIHVDTNGDLKVHHSSWSSNSWIFKKNYGLITNKTQ